VDASSNPWVNGGRESWRVYRHIACQAFTPAGGHRQRTVDDVP